VAHPPARAAAALAALAFAAAPRAEPAVVTERRPLAGTLVSVTLSGVEEEAAAPALEAAFAPFERIEEAMNEWRPGSPLGALNAAAGSPAFTELPADLCDVLRAALDGARRTGGLFDPTWAALRDLWRFGDGQTGEVPSRRAVAARCPLVGHGAVELEGPAGGACRARLPRAGMQIGLGGIAKGWAVDRAAAALRARGVRAFLVQAGGDLYAAGLLGGRPWRIGIRDPRGQGEPFGWLPVSDRAFSTSGDDERSFVAGGRRYHHVIDPRTCAPAGASRSATVLARTATRAEVLSKAVFVLGGQAGLRLAEREGAAAVLVTAGNRVLVSASLRGRVRLGRPTP
jgi:thiamine biosynthesis lipoprotein